MRKRLSKVERKRFYIATILFYMKNLYNIKLDNILLLYIRRTTYRKKQSILQLVYIVYVVLELFLIN